VLARPGHLHLDHAFVIYQLWWCINVRLYRQHPRIRLDWLTFFLYVALRISHLALFSFKLGIKTSKLLLDDLQLADVWRMVGLRDRLLDVSNLRSNRDLLWKFLDQYLSFIAWGLAWTETWVDSLSERVFYDCESVCFIMESLFFHLLCFLKFQLCLTRLSFPWLCPVLWLQLFRWIRLLPSLFLW
jgi:hypothetical protein